MSPLLFAAALGAGAEAGSWLALPPDVAEPPLLVVLHGDGGAGPAAVGAAWAGAALARGVGVLALACPAALGCRGSFWQWNGEPAWLDAAIAAVGRRTAIDRHRLYLAGWSGGASYLGLRAPELGATFAAVVYHGGGIPWSGGCHGTRAPTLFLVGDRNPLHGLALRLRDEHVACGDDVTFRLLPGADHAAEWRGLAGAAGAIVDWMLTKRR